MAEYSELVKAAIREAQQTAAEQRKKATVSEIYEGHLLETEYIKRGGTIWHQIRVDGKITSESYFAAFKDNKWVLVFRR